MGPPPHPGPAVRSDGWTALHYAAQYGNRRIVRLLIASGADVNAQNRWRCAVCACRKSAEIAGRVPAAVCLAGGLRCTGPRSMAIPNPSRSSCCAAPTGPSRTATGIAALRCTAEPKPQQPRTRRAKPKRVAEANGKLAEYEAGERLVHLARRLPPPPTPASRPVPPRAAGADGCAVGARRASGHEGDQRSTRTVTGALAARLVVH